MPGPERERRCRSRRHVIPSGVERCGECKVERDTRRRAAGLVPDVERTCASGKHIIPGGAHRCLECKRDNDRERRELRPPPNAVARLRALHLPLGDILAGAACSPEDAHLFDVGAPKHEKPAEGQRHARARAICAGCPVADACYADAYATRQMGVYGGRVLDQGFWSSEGRKNAKALVQSVQDVQDSSAC